MSSQDTSTVPEIIVPLTWPAICADYLASLTAQPETAEIPAAMPAELIDETLFRR